MSSTTPLFETIEADDPEYERRTSASGNINPPPPTQSGGVRPAQQMATNPGDAESGIAGILRQSAHPTVLFFLYFFRIAAITVYILSGFFISNYVLSSVIVVVLLAMDFWNCRVDDDGESYWVFESRDVRTSRLRSHRLAVTEHPHNAAITSRESHRLQVRSDISPRVMTRTDAPVLLRVRRMFWIAVYTFPLLWLALLIVSILKFNLSFIPIVVLALVFNVTNAIGFTYADRDAKQKWANNLASSGWNMGIGGIGGQILTGVVKNSVGRVFG
ncbi:hypothetical protein BN946_scf184977.g8 [Trametes cinnabarina]|uniref:Golgi apparatus membrane protein TVP23 n=1 Tax=Pycnoporus cinnabarinus TaxID=5643 RepID=A0A060SDQ7_PYCCI|nr:hypothetical protein BN946_scf184977.g8 [Trametes cinnabarina]